MSKTLLISRSEIELAERILIYAHYQKNIRYEIENMLSPEFQAVLQKFPAEKDYLRLFWIQQVMNLVNDNHTTLKLTTLILDETNVENTVLPADGLVSLEMNLSNLTIHHLQSLLKKIDGRSIHSIHFNGDTLLSDNDLASFLEQLHKVDLITVADTLPISIQTIASQIDYRNNFIKILGIEVKSNLWKAVIEEWVKLASTYDWVPLNHLNYINPLVKQKKLKPKHIVLLSLDEEKEAVERDQANFIDPKLIMPNSRFYAALNTCVLGMGDLFFDNMLKQIENDTVIDNSHNDVRLVINHLVTEAQLAKLAFYIRQHKEALPFSTLALEIDVESIKLNAFSDLLNALRNSTIQRVELIVDKNTVYQNRLEIEGMLNQYVLPHASYPVIIIQSSPAHQQVLILPEFEKNIIANIQKQNHNKWLFDGNHNVNNDNVNEIKEEKDPAASNLFAKKIKLKELMERKLRPENRQNYIQLDVQHVEVVEEEQVQEVNVVAEVNVEVNVAAEAQAHARYEGELINYGEFVSPHQPYGKWVTANHPVPDDKINVVNPNPYLLIQNELFGNLPHAIKYLTPEAATQIAKNMNALSTFNAHNLPPHFILKQTENGEKVLDYDAYIETETNVFTPRTYPLHKREELLYNVELDAKQVEEWIANPYLFDSMFRHANQSVKNKLTNLWIKFGDAGVKAFFDNINAVEQNHPGFSRFIYDNYLTHFSQWGHLLDNRDFFESLDTISKYDAIKIATLKKFLEETGFSQHHLKYTIQAFEVFWEKLQALCKKHNADINKINSAWRTPTGGNPIVYMERLLTILENARNLDEQFDCLEDLKLNNYGAYYASKYEGFKLVSSEMKLNYDRVACNTKPFNRNAQIYRVELATLVDQAAHPAPHIYSFGFHPAHVNFPRLAYRFMGQQQHGMRIKEHLAHLGKFYFGYKKEDVYLFSLFVATHERYTGKFPFETILKNLKDVESKDLAAVNRNLFELYKLDIKLNESEGNAILERVVQCGYHRISATVYTANNKVKYEVSCAMLDDSWKKNYSYGKSGNRIHFESHGRAFESDAQKDYYITKLFKYLKNNKYGALKWLERLESKQVVEQESKLNNPLHDHLPFPFVLDTAEYLEEGNEEIATAYREDLLLFANLLGHFDLAALDFDGRQDHLEDKTELYFENSNNKVARSIRDNLDIVKVYLNKAATSPQPNNLDYAFKCLSQCTQYFTYERCLATFQEVDAIPVFDMKAVDAILKKHRYKLAKKAVPTLFTRDNLDIKSMMIMAITSLDKLSSPENKLGISSIFALVKSAISEEKEELAADNLIEHKEEQKDDLVHAAQNSPAFELDQKDVPIPAANQKADLMDAVKNIFSGVPDEKLGYTEEELQKLDVKELQVILDAVWQRSGMLLSFTGKAIIKVIINLYKTQLIDDYFNAFTPSVFVDVLKEKIKHLPDYAECDSFERLDRVLLQASTITRLALQITQRDNFIEHVDVIANLFREVNFANVHYETLFALFTLLSTMPQRHYVGILTKIIHETVILENKDHSVILFDQISKLHAFDLPSEYIEKIVELIIQNSGSPEIENLVADITAIYRNNNKLLGFLFKQANLNWAGVTSYLSVIKWVAPENQNTTATLFAALHAKSPQYLVDFLDSLNQIEKDDRIVVLDIIAKSYHVESVKVVADQGVDYPQLVRKIVALGHDNLKALHQFYQASVVSTKCLVNGLNNRDVAKPMPVFLADFERAPFGKRDFKAQFDISEVERVINQSKDLLNQSQYTYQYRKQWMEAFLFVNKAGYDLPVYRDKAAKDLSNAELADIFLEIKSDKSPHLNNFQKSLYALPLIREAMYRATGKFPYSTQMLGLIDGLMHRGDVISNIDTGQGKSMIDTMKASLLLLISDRVDITTSSLVDSRRDIALSATFFQLLRIPYSKNVIKATSEFHEFEPKGINFSVFSSLLLFFSKARAQGVNLDAGSEKISLIMNESDYSVLDDRTVSRYAATDRFGVSAGNEWIYDAINEFVTSFYFRNGQTSEEEDIGQLRNHLKMKAKMLKKSPDIIDAFSYERLLVWVESAIQVNYSLRENFDYVIPELPEKKMIRNKLCETRSAKILTLDGKVSQETTFGAGAQQLLYALHNSRLAPHVPVKFVIEPESKTILSSNNNNLIEYYRSKKGFIWGSSGTVGSTLEIQEQYEKYGFEFSKLEPHQKNIVKHTKPVLLDDEEKQFKAIVNGVNGLTRKNKDNIAILFCKDIETAQRLFAAVSLANHGKFANRTLLYTGVGDEEDVIKEAAKPGKIIITTSALGRNTDIAYNKKLGMSVFHTSIDSVRSMGQKSGRTGRQGSPGSVHYYLNKQELHGKSIEQIQRELDEKSANDRAFNEELYHVFYHFLNALDMLQTEDFSNGSLATFIYTQWSVFSQQTEAHYRDLKINHRYDRNDFVPEKVKLFTRLLAHAVKPEKIPVIAPEAIIASLTQKHQLPAAQVVYQQNVKIADCVLPEVVAYGFLDKSLAGHAHVVDKDAIKRKLKALFSAQRQGKAYEANKDYFSYLNQNAKNIKLIRQAHQEFLSDHIKERSSNYYFIKRWLGVETELNKIANDKNYLLLFKTLTTVQGEETLVPFDEMKNIVTALLDQYLANSWFINSHRRKETIKLLEAIAQTEDLEELVAMMTQGKVDMIASDISTNKNAFWRCFKGINSNGNSRFQNTMDNAFALVTSLTGKNINDDMVKGLTEQLKSVVKNENEFQQFEKTPHFDNLKAAAPTLKYNDKGNANVLINSLDKTLKNGLHYQTPFFMRGRAPLGQPDKDQLPNGKPVEGEKEEYYRPIIIKRVRK